MSATPPQPVVRQSRVMTASLPRASSARTINVAELRRRKAELAAQRAKQKQRGPVSRQLAGQAPPAARRARQPATNRAAPQTSQRMSQMPRESRVPNQGTAKGIRVRAKYAYSARNSDELSFAKGDELIVVAKSRNKGWYRGRSVASSQSGLIPGTHVVKV